MHIQKIVKARAKQYTKLPFEMRLLLTILLYIVVTLITIGDGVLLLGKHLQQVSKRISPSIEHVSITTFSRIRILVHAGKTWIARIPSSINTKIRTFTLRKTSKKKITKKKLITIFPLPFSFKVKYFLRGTFFSALFFFFPLLVIIFIQTLPSPYELTLRQIPQTTKIFDRNGILIDQIYAAQNRTLIALNDVPQQLQHATLAIEDKNFYHHPGFDITSIIRALKANTTGGNFQGGSTITQQLIKSAMLTPEPSIVRKIKEVTLAFLAERIYTKKQILQMYFNQVPYGGTAWGIEAAAETYFGKKTQDLNLAESAFLAGITSAPTTYSPFGTNPTLWKKRQKEVLNRMVALRYISADQATEATQQNIQFRPQQIPAYAPHFVAYIKDFLIKKYGLATVEKGGLSVITTIDVKTQAMAQKIVTEEVTNAASLNISSGGALITNPTNGDILAMVGGKDFTDPNGGNVNITTSFRQPGSSIKVVTYSAALSKGITAATIIEDRPTAFAVPGAPSYTPVNYDGHYYGRVPLRYALANSLNIPAVKTLQQVGIPTMVNLARDMGIQSWSDDKNFGLSVTLGGYEVTMLDMATVFGTLAHMGARVDLNPILKITDYKGTLLEQKQPTEGKQVLSHEVAFIMSDILGDNQARSFAFGPNTPLVIPGHSVSVKTGTSDNKRDNWTVGYTNNAVVTVWVGNLNGDPMNQRLASGISGAAPIWNKIMTNYLTQNPETRFNVPQDITQKLCFGRVEYFVRGTENSTSCNSNNPSSRYSSLPAR